VEGEKQRIQWSKGCKGAGKVRTGDVSKGARLGSEGGDGARRVWKREGWGRRGPGVRGMVTRRVGGRCEEVFNRRGG